MKIRLTSYTFNAAAKTVTAGQFSDVTLAGIQLIVNATDHVIIYNFADATKKGTLSTDTLTLDYDTTSMSDTDELMILVEDGTNTQPVSGTFWQATQPVSAVSLPLPSGAATSAKQDTGNTSLASIDGKITAVNTGAVVVSSSSSDPLIGAVNETAPATDTASSGLNGRLQRIAQRLTSLIAAVGSPFQAGGSIGNTTFAATQSGTWTEANSATRLSESDFDTKTGALTETAPATDTASSGLNGRLQRIAQRLTSAIAAIGSPFQAGGSIGNTSFGATQATAANLNMTEANSGSIKTAVEKIDDFISGSRGLVTEDNSGSIKTAVEKIDDFISGSRGLVTEDNSAAIKTSVELIDDAISTDDTSTHTPATTKAVNIALVADETSTDSVNEGDLGMPRMTLNRQQVVTIRPNADGEGLDVYHLVSAASTNLTNIKASAGKVYGWYIYNSNTSMRKLCFHNNSGSPTAGASIFFSLPIPAVSGANVEFTNGIPFSSGIAISTVTGLADNDTAAVALNDLTINIFYK